jgi:hypothetical protein
MGNIHLLTRNNSKDQHIATDVESENLSRSVHHDGRVCLVSILLSITSCIVQAPVNILLPPTQTTSITATSHFNSHLANVMSFILPHLRTGWHVDQAIMNEEERLVVIRFGRDHEPDCMRQDEVLYKIADRVKNFAVLYGGVAQTLSTSLLEANSKVVCDLDEVPDFKQMYGK